MPPLDSSTAAPLDAPEEERVSEPPLRRPSVPPFTLRRPRSVEDFRKIATWARCRWGASRIFRPMQTSELRRSHAGSSPRVRAPFYATSIGKDHRLHPAAKNWCFFLLEDALKEAAGLFFWAGMTEAARDHHLRPDVIGLPVDDLSWSDAYVPDPARPELCRHSSLILLADWSRYDLIEPLVDAFYRCCDLFQCDTLFTQLAEGGDDDLSWIGEQLLFRRLRARPPGGPRSAIESVWVWERQTMRAPIARPSRSTLEATPSQIASLAAFYQSLSRAEREELLYIINGFSVAATAERTCRDKRTIGNRRTCLRDALGISQEGLEEGSLDRLRALGIDPERASLHDLSSLFCQPNVAQALGRIAWFYGEEI